MSEESFSKSRLERNLSYNKMEQNLHLHYLLLIVKLSQKEDLNRSCQIQECMMRNKTR